MEWDDLRFFLAVARLGGLTGASEHLRVSPSTVGRRLSQLEQTLGSTLFAHHQTGYLLTDDGKALFAHAERVEDAVLELERVAMGRDLEAHGVVRLATAENIANFVIIPALPAFMARYPGIILELVTGIGSVNLAKHEADLALRLKRPEQGNVNIKRLGAQHFGLYASRDYLAAFRATGKSFAEIDLITWADGFAFLPMTGWVNDLLDGRGPRLRTSSLFAQVVAVREGLGAAVLPCFIADGDPVFERIEVSGDPVTQDLWLVIHRDLAASSRVRAVATFIEELISSQRKRFEGDRR
jgi:DNA-binding transcriptional LysR family regulator